MSRSTLGSLPAVSCPPEVLPHPDASPTADQDLEKGGVTSATAVASDDQHSNKDNVHKSESEGLVVVVDWDGPDDPMDPRNWSALRKWSAVGAVGLMCFVSPLASTLIAPAAETIAADPDFMITNPSITSLIVSIFILGYALGPLIASPVSELYGRSLVMQVSMGIFLIFNVACAVAKSPAQMIVFRLFAGIGGAAPITVGAGVIADIFLPGQRGAALSVFSLTAMFGPVVGPVAGGFIVENLHWRWCFWILVVVSGVTFAISPFILTESYHLVLLRAKAARIRKDTGNARVTTALELAHGTKTPRAIIFENLTRPFALLFTNPACFLLSVYLSISYGYLYLLYTSFAFVFTDRYHETIGISGLHYIAPGLGSFVACGACALWMDRAYRYVARRSGGPAIPEHRAPVMLAASVVMPVGLIVYGWTAERGVLWLWPDVGVFIFMAATMVTFLALNTYIVDAFKHAASAMAATTVMRSVAGALFPLFGDAMFQSPLGLGWAHTLLALLALVVGVAYPVFLWSYGPRMRAGSNTDR